MLSSSRYHGKFRIVVVLLILLIHQCVLNVFVSGKVICDDTTGKCEISCERHCDGPDEKNVDSNGNGIPGTLGCSNNPLSSTHS
jgi:hypothetical protein